MNHSPEDNIIPEQATQREVKIEALARATIINASAIKTTFQGIRGLRTDEEIQRKIDSVSTRAKQIDKILETNGILSTMQDEVMQDVIKAGAYDFILDTPEDNPVSQ